MKVKSLLFIALIGCSILLSGQDKENKLTSLKRNIITGNLGLIEFNLNYERVLFVLDRATVNMRVGYGWWDDWGGSGNNIYFVNQYVIGRRLSKLELGIGAKFKIDDCCGGDWLKGVNNIYSTDLYPVLNIGYRFEKPEGGFVFRFGFGTESFVNLGFGYKF